MQIHLVKYLSCLILKVTISFDNFFCDLLRWSRTHIVLRHPCDLFPCKGAYHYDTSCIVSMPSQPACAHLYGTLVSLHRRLRKCILDKLFTDSWVKLVFQCFLNGNVSFSKSKVNRYWRGQRYARGSSIKLVGEAKWVVRSGCFNVVVVVVVVIIITIIININITVVFVFVVGNLHDILD